LGHAFLPPRNDIMISALAGFSKDIRGRMPGGAGSRHAVEFL
jgi:hypothetical protein